MEAIISSLVSRFEKGALTRRELVQGLTTLAAVSGTASAQVPSPKAQDAAIKGTKIDHVSIQVSDLPRSIAFYQKMFGLTILSEDKPNEIVRLGAGKVLVFSPPQESDRLGGSLRDRSGEVRQGLSDAGTESTRGKSGRQPGCRVPHLGSGRNQRADCRRLKEPVASIELFGQACRTWLRPPGRSVAPRSAHTLPGR